MMRLRLVYRGDFRKSEETLYAEALKKHPELNLRNGDCILLVSSNGKLLKFVYGFTEHDLVFYQSEKVWGKTKILESVTYRISGSGSWNPLMLQNYANHLGLELAGLKRFEEYYKNGA